MPITFTAATTKPAAVDADLLAIPAFAGRKIGPGGDAIGGGAGIGTFLAETGFDGKAGETIMVPATGVAARGVLLVGLGPKNDVDIDVLRRAAAAVARRAAKSTSVATTLLDVVPNLDRRVAAQAIAEGAALGGYQFLKYKREPKPAALNRFIVLTRIAAGVQDGLDRGAAIAAAVCWARDLVNEPAGGLTPSDLAAAAVAMAERTGLSVRVLDEVAIASEGLGGLLGVAQGSDQPPRLIRLEYSPARARRTVALVGKGITFDSGGLSLKTAEGMETMKTDMSGAATVLATMSVLPALGVSTRVIAFVPTTENMPGGRAIKPGDVIKIRNGKTVEVLNTDAEGRLILADGLSLASEEHPDAIVDIATLTGACVVALGEKYGGVMGNNDEWVQSICSAAVAAGERMWPLPLPKEYRKLLDSEIADLKNVAQGRYGGALTAGLFLQEFVDGAPWAHLDIAGPSRASSDDGVNPKGGTGFGVRTLVRLLADPDPPAKPKGAPSKSGRPAPKRQAPKRQATGRSASNAQVSKVAKSVRKTTGTPRRSR